MATSYTPNKNLAKPATGDRNWGTTLNGDLDALDADALGPLSVILTEVPSTTLNVEVAAGVYVKSDGTLVSYAGVDPHAVTASATNYLYLTDAGVLTSSTSSFPATLHVRLAIVVAGATAITSIADARVPWASSGVTVFLALAGGTFADGSGVVTVETGTTNGVKLGGGATSKLGFFGKTPIVQPTIGAGTAGGTYTATEQAMLQAVFNAVRALGLGS